MLLAAVLGIVSGVAAAYVVPELDSDQDDPPSTSASTDGDGDATDPLGLGISMENLDCTSQSILVLKTGAGFPALQPAVANNRDLELKYLRTDQSCDTLWVPPDEEHAEYVAYLGPFDSPGKPCKMRLTARHKRTMVLRLIEDVPMYVKCMCVRPYSDFPELSVDSEQDAESSVYVWQLQNALARRDESRRQEGEDDEPDGGWFKWHEATSVMDERTDERVRALQAEVGLAPTGLVDTETWHAVVDLACKHFDF